MNAYLAEPPLKSHDMYASHRRRYYRDSFNTRTPSACTNTRVHTSTIETIVYFCTHRA